MHAAREIANQEGHLKAPHAEPARLDRRKRRLVGQFYLSMLAIAAIDFCFAVIYEVPLERFAPTAAAAHSRANNG